MATQTTDALRNAAPDLLAAVEALEGLVNALEWCDTRYRQTLAGKPVLDVDEMRAYVGRTLTDARAVLRRLRGEEGDR